MTPQTFSLKMCRHLSSLVPGFEGHWKWIKYKDGFAGHYESPRVYCGEVVNKNWEIICPAWQVEDLFRNWMKIIIALPNEKCNGFVVFARNKDAGVLRVDFTA